MVLHILNAKSFNLKTILQFCFLACICFNLNAQTVGLLEHSTKSLDNGYVLFAPTGSYTTYLIDKCGKLVKTWPSTYRPGQAVYLLPDGSLLHTGSNNNSTFNGGGQGGIIEKIDWDGNVIWSYQVSDATKCQHHDVRALPNGNVLVIAWEIKTNSEAIALGRKPNLTSAVVWSEQILEIQPIGATGGHVVWEWHLWDHLVQDFDIAKPNYNVVSANPQLVNINFAANANISDWIHLNSIDYYAELDQILVSSHEMSEIWIIDHSTTLAEASSHLGGNSGKGGDLLYRWGNPASYNTGAAADKKFFGQHNAHWIDKGLPYENKIMVFNNGLNRTGGNYSTAEIIEPPVDGFNYNSSLPYLPTSHSWIYNDGNTNNYYAMNISGAQQLSNGNVLLCNGPSGLFTEVDSSGNKVWEYKNPVSSMGILAQNSTPKQNLVFRCQFYPTDFIGFAGKTLVAGGILENTNTFSENCKLIITATNTAMENEFQLFPNPARDFITLKSDNIYVDNATISLINCNGNVVYTKNTRFDSSCTIETSRIQSGIYFIHFKSNQINFIKKVVILP